jgi:threonyl-tRNA synthetase
MLRHMRSLRSMRRDNGWIHTLLEEAENERMHLLTFMQLRQPGMAFRGAVLAGQGVFFNLYLVMYTFFPKTCHSFVGVSATRPAADRRSYAATATAGAGAASVSCCV